MKKTMIIGILLGLVITFVAQAEEKYCQIVGTRLITKIVVTIDYGTGEKVKLIKTKEGKWMKFKSMIEALNYMSNDGWRFVTAYAITKGNQHVYHFLLKKTGI